VRRAGPRSKTRVAAERLDQVQVREADPVRHAVGDRRQRVLISGDPGGYELGVADQEQSDGGDADDERRQKVARAASIRPPLRTTER
jgi:hypothetical protein